MPTFRENANAAHDVNAIRIAVIKLSMADYQVIRFTGGTRPSIQVDKPFAGGDTETAITKHAEKTFGSCEYYGCRVYWELPQEQTP